MPWRETSAIRFLEAASLPMIVIGPQDRVVAFNEAAATDLRDGLDLELRVGAEVEAVLADRPIARASLSRWMEHARAGRSVKRTAHSVETGRDYQIDVFPLEDGAVCLHLRDVSAVQRLQDRLASTEAEARSILDAVDQPVFRLRWAGSERGFRFERLNGAAEQLLGASRTSLRGRPVASLRGRLDDASVDALRDALATAREHGASSQLELVRSLDGRDTCWLTRVTPQHGADGRVVGATVSALDMTAQRRATRALAQARDTAEHAVRRRTNFLASLGHEIRNPLGALLGFAEMLQHTTLDATQAAQVEALRRSGEQLRGLITDLLDLARVEARPLRLRRRAVDVRLRIEHALASARHVAHEGVALRSEAERPFPARLRLDPLRLDQILLNLVLNAAKFTTEGEVVVEARWRPRRRGGGQLEIDVCDTGPGVPDALVDQLFEPFVQGDGDRVDGSGLGLAISKGLAERMGGTLTYRARRRGGSRFQLVLPATRREADVDGLEGRRLALAAPEPEVDRLANLLADAGALVTPLHAPHDEGVAALPPNVELVLATEDLADGLRPLLHALPRPVPLLSVACCQPRGTTPDGVPVEDPEVDLVPAVLARLEQTDLDLGRRRALSVFAVEDHRTNRDLLRQMLSRLGHSVRFAASAADALRVSGIAPYDLLVLDMTLPDTRSLGEAAVLRRRLGHDVPAILWTGDADTLSRARVREHGFVGVLPKPTDLATLDRLLTHAVADPASGAGAEDATPSADGPTVEA